MTVATTQQHVKTVVKQTRKTLLTVLTPLRASRSGSALLSAAHSEGQTQIPDTWRLEKEREGCQPKRNGQNQQPDDEAATADSRA